MPKKFFKRWLPAPEKIRDHKSLRFLGKLLHDPNIFHLNRGSVSRGFALGIAIAFLPIIGQTQLAATLALFCRANVVVAAATTWITNPVTMTPIFYMNYELGRWMLGLPTVAFSIELTWEWMSGSFLEIWKPLLLGSLVLAVLSSSLGYLIIQALWRWQVTKTWRKRVEERKRRGVIRRQRKKLALEQYQADESEKIAPEPILVAHVETPEINENRDSDKSDSTDAKPICLATCSANGEEKKSAAAEQPTGTHSG